MHAHKGRQARPLAERFWEKVDVRSAAECWFWIGSIDTRGYGTIGANSGRPLLRAHRVSFELKVGSIPGVHPKLGPTLQLPKANFAKKKPSVKEPRRYHTPIPLVHKAPI